MTFAESSARAHWGMLTRHAAAANNSASEPAFTAAPNTPSVNGLSGPLTGATSPVLYHHMFFWGVARGLSWSVAARNSMKTGRVGAVGAGADLQAPCQRVTSSFQKPSDRPLEQKLDQWFSTASFAQPAQYTFGNAGRTAAYGPGAVNINVSGSKISPS
jgi:hypothetical protein